MDERAGQGVVEREAASEIEVDEQDVMVYRSLTPEELRQDPELEELARAIDPIRGLVRDVTYYCSEDGEARSVQVRFGSGNTEVILSAMVHKDMLTLNVPVGEVPPTAEAYASLLAHNLEGPWWYRVDGVDTTAIVVRVCQTHRSRVAQLSGLMAGGWRDYFKVQALLEVLNGKFDLS